MKRSSIFALCLTLLIAAFGSAAFGQSTAARETGTSTFRPGTYTGVATGRYRLTLKPASDGDFTIKGVYAAGEVYTVTGLALHDGGFVAWIWDWKHTLVGRFWGGWSGSGLRILRIQHGANSYGPKREVDILLNPADQRVAQQGAASEPQRAASTPQPRAATASQPVPAGATFGLVSKVLGHVPPPGEGSNGTFSGSMDEKSFRIEFRMRPPSVGYAFVAHHYSSQLTSRLKPGQIVELTCWSDAERTGRDAPNIGSGCQWGVSGGGAEVIESTHTFAGTASDGKFYPLSRAVTRFKVLKSGTITIVAGQSGQLWGGSDNWNPATYVYKSGEIPAASVIE